MLVDYTYPGASIFRFGWRLFNQFGAQPPCLLRETALFDTLHSELAIVLEETRDDEIDVDRLATRLLDNDGDKWLIIGLTEGATAVLAYDRLMNSITRTLIETDGLDGNRGRHIDHKRTEGQVLESVQQLGRAYFNWVHPRYRWVFDTEYTVE
ncbi:hypothetical protein [Haladaptatus halobius]|uniref:hypothetical protein n=1 Tax=Haladaptatus halobius TaxID=2884875 RepID=UPI001D09B364|nr:hypothetical protein [Haladaptatus halobius]